MITLKEALSLSAEEIKAFREELKSEIEAKKVLNAYVGMEESGEGIPLLIKDNIQVKDWSVTGASKILQGYIAPYDATVITNLKAKGLSPLVELTWMSSQWAQQQKAHVMEKHLTL